MFPSTSYMYISIIHVSFEIVSLLISSDFITESSIHEGSLETERRKSSIVERQFSNVYRKSFTTGTLLIHLALNKEMFPPKIYLKL